VGNLPGSHGRVRASTRTQAHPRRRELHPHGPKYVCTDVGPAGMDADFFIFLFFPSVQMLALSVRKRKEKKIYYYLFIYLILFIPSARMLVASAQTRNFLFFIFFIVRADVLMHLRFSLGG
jgi:hypothetical protein